MDYSERLGANDRATLDAAYELSMRMRLAEPERDVVRQWVVFEEVAETLLKVYSVPTPGVQTAVDMESLKAEAREQVRAELVAAGWTEPTETEADADVKPSLWRKWFGGG